MTTNPVKAIREKCLRCCCDQPNEVALCHIEACPLWPFRMGKNPYRKKPAPMSEERRAAASERMKAYNAKKHNVSNSDFE